MLTPTLTALMLAAVRGYKEIVDTLMKNKRVDPNIQRKDGMTALMFASHEGHAEIVNKLQKKLTHGQIFKMLMEKQH